MKGEKTMQANNLCPCSSNKNFGDCCQLYISKEYQAPSPEALMRSRYTAYYLKDYEYIICTYVEEKATKLSVKDIKAASDDTIWLDLQVLSSFAEGDVGEVEFIARYGVLDPIESTDGAHKQPRRGFYQMHERSRFVLQDSRWRYLDGDNLSQTGPIKLGRNETCLCGSGKKYKRCCAK